MPTYDYRCNACHHEFELFQSMKDSPKKKCPECGKNALERLIGTGAGILFKGSGFYETDYRSPAYKKDAEADTAKKSDKPDSKSNGAKTESSGESTSAPKKPCGPGCGCASNPASPTSASEPDHDR